NFKMFDDTETQIVPLNLLTSWEMSDEEIAPLLGWSIGSVQSQRHQLMDKLGLTSIVDLRRYAIEHGYTRRMSSGWGQLQDGE
ncbi:MAG TPA: hypothetical protein PLN52_12900, partial [Opitutaceae bacterium]|nr:hypothetical protein [Opitutaceae bacterium]